MTKFLEKETLDELQEIKDQSDISNEEYYDLLFLCHKFREKKNPKLTDSALAEIIKTSLEFYQKQPETSFTKVFDEVDLQRRIELHQKIQSAKEAKTERVKDCLIRALIALGYVREQRQKPIEEDLSDQKDFKTHVMREEKKFQEIASKRPSEMSIHVSRRKNIDNTYSIVLNFFWYEMNIGNIEVDDNNTVRYLINDQCLQQHREYVANVLEYIESSYNKECWDRINFFVQRSGTTINNGNQFMPANNVIIGDDGNIVIQPDVFVDEDGAIIGKK